MCVCVCLCVCLCVLGGGGAIVMLSAVRLKERESISNREGEYVMCEYT